jgi:hypothetical protein
MNAPVELTLSEVECRPFTINFAMLLSTGGAEWSAS